MALCWTKQKYGQIHFDTTQFDDSKRTLLGRIIETHCLHGPSSRCGFGTILGITPLFECTQIYEYMPNVDALLPRGNISSIQERELTEIASGNFIFAHVYERSPEVRVYERYSDPSARTFDGCNNPTTRGWEEIPAIIVGTRDQTVGESIKFTAMKTIIAERCQTDMR